MYSNIGRKIKTLAQLFGWLCLIGGVAAGVIIGIDDGLEDSWYFIVGGIVGLISSWPLYGFGDLIENVQKIAAGKEAPKAPAPQVKKEEAPESVPAQAEKKFVCEACGEYFTGWYQECPNCHTSGKMKRRA